MSGSVFKIGPNDWQQFLELLQAYVALELRGEDAGLAMPQIEFWIEANARCERAYYEEFRRQGLSAPEEALQSALRGGNEKEPFHPASAMAVDEDQNADWVQEAFVWGVAWLERAGRRWRRVRIDVGALGGPDSTGATPAWQGMMGSEDESVQGHRRWRMVPTEAPFDVRMLAEPDADQLGYAHVTVMVALHERLGDFSNVGVRLALADGSSHHAFTDEDGYAQFGSIAEAALAGITLYLDFPI